MISKICKFSAFSLEFQEFFSINRTIFSHSKGPSINYVVSKSAIFDPLLPQNWPFLTLPPWDNLVYGRPLSQNNFGNKIPILLTSCHVFLFSHVFIFNSILKSLFHFMRQAFIFYTSWSGTFISRVLCSCTFIFKKHTL